MSALRFIRKDVLGFSQAELAAVAEVSQGTVSKWEAGELAPSLDEMSKIRAAALSRGIAWEDGWFFAVPAEIRA
ncbi:helix-turn-helix transcriptional regulator [Bradyrhizobium sp. USDA 4472]